MRLARVIEMQVAIVKDGEAFTNVASQGWLEAMLIACRYDELERLPAESMSIRRSRACSEWL